MSSTPMALSGRRPNPWKAGFHLGRIARPRKVSKDSPSASDQGQAGSGPGGRAGAAWPSYVTTSEAAGCRCIARGPSSLFLTAFFHWSSHRGASPVARALSLLLPLAFETSQNIHDFKHDYIILVTIHPCRNFVVKQFGSAVVHSRQVIR